MQITKHKNLSAEIETLKEEKLDKSHLCEIGFETVKGKKRTVPVLDMRSDNR